MRFGFFFFAEYIGVFIISALTVVLFLGGWNAPFPVAAHQLDRQPGLARARAAAARADRAGRRDAGARRAVLPVPQQDPLVGRADHRLRPVQRRRRRAVRAVGVHQLRLGRRPVLVPRQDVRARVPVRLDARHAAARADRPAHGLRLEVAAAGVAAQPVRDRARGPRDRRAQGRRLDGPADRPRPRPRHGQGHGPDAAPVLRAQGDGHVPGDAGRRRDASSAAASSCCTTSTAALKCETCFQCAQACPIECIDMGGMDTKGRFHVHWGPPETYGERREESALRRSGRTVPDQAYEHFAPFDLATIDEILDAHDHDPKHMLQILEATQAAFGYLPVAALKRISERTGAWYAMIYGTASYYGHLRFEPPAATAQASEVSARRAVRRRRTSRRSAPRSRAAPGPARRGAAGPGRRGRRPGTRLVSAILPSPKGWPSILLARAGAEDPTDIDAAREGRRVRGPAARGSRARAGGHDRRGRGERPARPRRRGPPHGGRSGGPPPATRGARAGTSSRTATARTRRRAPTGRCSRRTRTP